MNFKPALTLSIITTIIASLLIIAHNQLKVDENVISPDLLEKCQELMGEGEYELILDWKSEGYIINKPDNVKGLIKKDDGTLSFQIIVDGYAKDGLNLLIAMNNDGSVKNCSIIGINETPGLGTKVDNIEFLSKFFGKKEAFAIVSKTPENDSEIEAITGATYSSKGIAKAMNLAIETFKGMRG